MHVFSKNAFSCIVINSSFQRQRLTTEFLSRGITYSYHVWSVVVAVNWLAPGGVSVTATAPAHCHVVHCVVVLVLDLLTVVQQRVPCRGNLSW